MLGNLEKITSASGHSFRVLHWTNNLREVKSLIEPNHAESITGAGDHWHYHVEMELTTFIRGEGAFFVGDHIGPFSAGEVILLRENLPHHWNVRGPSAGFSVQWNFPPEHPFWMFQETRPLADLFKRAGPGRLSLVPCCFCGACHALRPRQTFQSLTGYSSVRVGFRHS